MKFITDYVRSKFYKPAPDKLTAEQNRMICEVLCRLAHTNNLPWLADVRKGLTDELIKLNQETDPVFLTKRHKFP